MDSCQSKKSDICNQSAAIKNQAYPKSMADKIDSSLDCLDDEDEEDDDEDDLIQFSCTPLTLTEAFNFESLL